jgi:hypothetical protein
MGATKTESGEKMMAAHLKLHMMHDDSVSFTKGIPRDNQIISHRVMKTGDNLF